MPRTSKPHVVRKSRVPGTAATRDWNAALASLMLRNLSSPGFAAMLPRYLQTQKDDRGQDGCCIRQQGNAQHCDALWTDYWLAGRGVSGLLQRRMLSA